MHKCPRRCDGSDDCVVPGSRDKDSSYAAHELKTQYGMRSLTVTWAPRIHTESLNAEAGRRRPEASARFDIGIAATRTLR